MILNYITEFFGIYNSDMNWANTILNPGERTCFFEYTDIHNKQNSKVFCYLKFFKRSSPVRIEFPTIIFHKHSQIIDEIMNLLYYLFLVQGQNSNPQIRPIAIAERYARETLKIFDLNAEIRRSGLTDSVNEERWGSK